MGGQVELTMEVEGSKENIVDMLISERSHCSFRNEIYGTLFASYLPDII